MNPDLIAGILHYKSDIYSLLASRMIAPELMAQVQAWISRTGASPVNPSASS
jgi:hypothetical protein